MRQFGLFVLSAVLFIREKMRPKTDVNPAEDAASAPGKDGAEEQKLCKIC